MAHTTCAKSGSGRKSLFQDSPVSVCLDPLLTQSSTIEINVGLTCSCLILLPAFLKRHLPESTKSSLRSFTFFNKLRSSKDSRNNPEWHGYQKQNDPYRRGSASDSCNLICPSGKQIVQADKLEMDVTHLPHYVPRDPEAGMPSLLGSLMSRSTYHVHQGPVVMGSST